MNALRRRFHRLLRRQRLTPTGPARIDRRHVYILPTRYGWLFALLLVLMLVASLNYDNNPAYLLTFLLFSLAANGMYFTWRNLYGLELRLHSPEPVFAGEDLAIRLHPSRGSRPALAFCLAEQVSLSDLEQESAAVELRIPTRQRGWMQPGELEITTSYPLGLFRAWSILELAEALVYPRPASEAELPPGGSGEQDDKSSEREGDEEFYALRDFKPGDPLSHIHWKGVARERGLMTKQFSGPGVEEPVVIDWDTFAPNDAETRLSLMTRLVIDAEQAGRAYGLSLPGSEISPALGTRQFHRCLKTLALFGSKAT